MAKRVVDFGNHEPVTTVKVRKKMGSVSAPAKSQGSHIPASAKPGSIQAADKPAKAPASAHDNAASLKSKTSPPKVSKNPAEKKPAKTLDYRSIFRGKYLEDVRKANDNAKTIMTDEARPDREYYHEKSVFLEKLIELLETGREPHQVDFSPLSEPFIWNEFQRISFLVYGGPKVQGENSNKISPAWRRAPGEIRLTLTNILNCLREKRDGYVLKSPPITDFNVIFCMNGTMQHLNRQIEAEPDKDYLRKLQDYYAFVYEKSGMKNRARKLVQIIKHKQAEDKVSSLWANPETVEYLLATTN